jgi:hypothetical protein
LTVKAIEVWQEPDGFWRWRYLDSEDGTDLQAAEVYERREEAIRGATLAYPGVTAVVLAQPRRPRGFISRLAKLGAIVAVALWLPRFLFRAIRRVRKVSKFVSTARKLAGIIKPEPDEKPTGRG